MRAPVPGTPPMRRRTPLVSLIVPVYGVAPYLPRFLSSLDAQDHPHDRLQVVLVLDGACDDSPRVCRSWARRTDLDVEVVETDNGGQGRARNLGMGRAQGQWIGFPDPDDWLAPDFLTRLLAARRRGDVLLAGRTLIHQGGAEIPTPSTSASSSGRLGPTPPSSRRPSSSPSTSASSGPTGRSRPGSPRTARHPPSRTRSTWDASEAAGAGSSTCPRPSTTMTNGSQGTPRSRPPGRGRAATSLRCARATTPFSMPPVAPPGPSRRSCTTWAGTSGSSTPAGCPPSHPDWGRSTRPRCAGWRSASTPSRSSAAPGGTSEPGTGPVSCCGKAGPRWRSCATARSPSCVPPSLPAGRRSPWVTPGPTSAGSSPGSRRRSATPAQTSPASPCGPAATAG